MPQQQQSLSHSHPGYGPPTTGGMPSGNMMPGYPPQQQAQRYNPYRQPPQQQGLSHMPYPTQQQTSPMQGQSVMGQQPPMGQVPVSQSPMQQPPLVWHDLWQDCARQFVTRIMWHELQHVLWQDCVTQIAKCCPTWSVIRLWGMIVWHYLPCLCYIFWIQMCVSHSCFWTTVRSWKWLVKLIVRG